MNNIRENLPDLREHKGLVVRLIILAVLVFLVVYSSSKMLLVYNERQETLSQISMMEDYLGKWNIKSAQLSEAAYRPVSKEKLDRTQTNIILGLQSLNLELAGLQEMTGKKEDNGRSFELEFSGAYNDTMQYLNNFRDNGALTSIKNLSMNMRDGKIITKLTYKIYTK